ncbi:MAG: gamma-glutamylaminecyclotransferase, partial [Parasphingorhabdus sp.]
MHNHPVFVYGTLKRGFPNHDAERLDGFFKDRATTENEYPLLVVNQRFSPVVVYEPGSGQKITGE